MGRAHLYGEHLHISENGYLRTLLARIGSPETPALEVPELMRAAYRQQLGVILDREFPVVHAECQTRMTRNEPRAIYSGPLLNPETRLVVVAVIRGGILPAQTCYEAACRVLPPDRVRLDYLNMSRVADETGTVTGVRFEGSKIGGPVNDAIVLIPEPMGATGGTVARVLDIYAELEGGPPVKTIAAHMMVTPEAVQRLTAVYPELRIYAGRFDRGLSPEDVLATTPGTHPDRERGLDDAQYIVPGAGGIGELLTNSWV